MRRYVLTGMLMLMGVLMTASVGHADMNADLRVKLGNAAGIDKLEFTNLGTANVSQDGGGNFQIEVVLSDRQNAGATLVGGFGIFGRTHKGNTNDPFVIDPTAVEYDAGGLSGTIGIGMRANENFHVEGRVELDLGSGKPTLTPLFGPPYNPVREGGYVATALIFGGYYTVSKPGLQIGLELGVQSFTGEFQILNNFGFWNDAKVTGSGGIANFVIGARF